MPNIFHCNKTLSKAQFCHDLTSKLFGVLLILILVAPIPSSYFYLQVQKKKVKKEVKWKMIAGLDREELVLFKFTENEILTQLNWKHSKEFEYRGEMYDIVEAHRVGDSIHYWVWWDHEETKLCKQLKGLVSYALGNHPKNQESKKRLMDFFKTLYFEELKTNDIVFLIQHKRVEPCFDKILYQNIISQPIAPPPELF